MNQFDLIIFDMDGTLYKFDSSGKDDAIFKTKFYKEVEEGGVLFIENKLSVSREDAQIIREDVFGRYNSDTSIGLEKEFDIPRKEYFSETWNIDADKYIDSDQKLRTLLTKISCKKAVLTNAPQVWAKNVLKQLGIADLFDGFWFGDGDIRKPDRRAYLQVVDSLNVKPERTVIVEDEPKCLRPAKELGMTTILLGSGADSWVDYYVKEIYEIINLIGGGKNVTTTLENR